MQHAGFRLSSEVFDLEINLSGLMAWHMGEL